MGFKCFAVQPQKKLSSNTDPDPKKPRKRLVPETYVRPLTYHSSQVSDEWSNAIKTPKTWII
eukprot:2900338-Rhodomonas_salina.1